MTNQRMIFGIEDKNGNVNVRILPVLRSARTFRLPASSYNPSSHSFAKFSGTSVAPSRYPHLLKSVGQRGVSLYAMPPT